MKFQNPTHWYTEANISKLKLTPAVQEWLLYRPSMTERLLQHCDDFAIEVLSTQQCKPQHDDAKYLAVDKQQQVYQREVHIYCDQQPWVYGRTVAPLTSLKGQLSDITTLNEKPLGKLLFSLPDINRSPFEITYLLPDSHEYQCAT